MPKSKTPASKGSASRKHKPSSSQLPSSPADVSSNVSAAHERVTASSRADSRSRARPGREPSESEGASFRAGFALLLGRPNVGKSTLLNRLVGEHLAIVSPRPQTTRQRILGIVNQGSAQLCLIDTPGVHRAKGIFNRAMVDAAISAIDEVDIVLFLAEAGWPDDPSVDPEQVDPVGPFNRELLARIRQRSTPVVLVLTKVDRIPKPLLLPLIDRWRNEYDFALIYPLSGLTGANVDGFVDAVSGLLPESEPLFSADTLTDQSERALCAELIREQVFLQTHDEVPYGTAVVIEEFDESQRPMSSESDELDAAAVEAASPEADEVPAHLEPALAPEFEPSESRAETLSPGLVRIHATIIVERDSHKAIIIGRGGSRLREVGKAARYRIERLLGCRVWLGLHVRVMPRWTEKRSMLVELGLAGPTA